MERLDEQRGNGDGPAKVRVALVSASGTGRKRTLPALRDSNSCRVTALHARDEARVLQLGEDFGVPHVYTDLERMISDGQFDVAVVCSPPFMHLQQLEMLMRAGIPTLCEKPLALSEKDALVIEAMADGSSTLVMVAHQLRHQNTYAEIRLALAAGEIGEVESACLEWSFLLDHADPKAVWKLDPALNGPTCLTDAGVHCLDVAIGLFGPGALWGANSHARQGAGVIEACDLLAVHSGVRVTYEVSRSQAPVANHLVITGSKGEIVAPHFFTESSAPLVRVLTEGAERVVERAPGNPYGQVVEDFAAAAFDPDFVSPGTSLAEAVAACRMIDEAQVALGL
jgi:predicted dehydrogenase